MAQDPELHLWRKVLTEALHDDDAAQWIRTQDAAMVCALAGLDRDAVLRAFDTGVTRLRRRAA